MIEPEIELHSVDANCQVRTFAFTKSSSVPPTSKIMTMLLESMLAIVSLLGEVNEMRANPAAYATQLESRLRQFRGNVLHRPGQAPIRTREGPAAVREAIRPLGSG